MEEYVTAKESKGNKVRSIATKDNQSLKEIEEAREQEVLSLLKRGMPINKIAKNLRLSVRRIIQIRDTYLGKSGQERSEGEIAAEAFKLFETGSRPEKVVIELKQPPVTVNKLYHQWAEMKGMLIITRAEKKEIFEIINGFTNYSVNDLPSLIDVIGRLVDDHNEVSSLRLAATILYPCSRCGKDMAWYLWDKSNKEHIMKILENGNIARYRHSSCS